MHDCVGRSSSCGLNWEMRGGQQERLMQSQTSQTKANVWCELCVYSDRKCAECKQEVGGAGFLWNVVCPLRWAQDDLTLVTTRELGRCWHAGLWMMWSFFNDFLVVCALWHFCRWKRWKRCFSSLSFCVCVCVCLCVCVCVFLPRGFIHYSLSDIKDVDVVRDICRRDTQSAHTQTWAHTLTSVVA